MDPIADMLTIIRNTIRVNRFDATVSYSKVKWHLLSLMKEIGLITDVATDEKKRTLSFTIAHKGKQAVFHTINRLSTPGRRQFVGWKEIRRPEGNGLVIVSTPQGLMTGKTARHRKLGGELICEIY